VRVRKAKRVMGRMNRFKTNSFIRTGQEASQNKMMMMTKKSMVKRMMNQRKTIVRKQMTRKKKGSKESRTK
jgi:hypothetical protein